MVEFMGMVVNLIWSVLSIQIPLINGVNITFWQFFLFIALGIVLYRSIKMNVDSGGGK